MSGTAGNCIYSGSNIQRSIGVEEEIVTAHDAAVGNCGYYVEYEWDGFGSVDFAIASNYS